MLVIRRIFIAAAVAALQTVEALKGQRPTNLKPVGVAAQSTSNPLVPGNGQASANAPAPLGPSGVPKHGMGSTPMGQGDNIPGNIPQEGSILPKRAAQQNAPVSTGMAPNDKGPMGQAPGAMTDAIPAGKSPKTGI